MRPNQRRDRRNMNRPPPSALLAAFFVGGFFVVNRARELASAVVSAVKQSLLTSVEMPVIEQISEAAKAGTSLATGGNKHAISVASSIAKVSHDPFQAALSSSGFTAIGAKFHPIAGGVLGVLSGLGCWYVYDTVKKSIMEFNENTNENAFPGLSSSLKNIRRGIIVVSTLTGFACYRCLSLNSFSLPYLLFCTNASLGAGAVFETLLTHSVFASSDMQLMLTKIERLHARNQELIAAINQKLMVGAQGSISANTTVNYISPNNDTDDAIICPITRMIINDPIIPADGHAYERAALQEWYDRSHSTCPLNPSATLINPRSLETDEELYNVIQEYVRQMKSMEFKRG